MLIWSNASDDPQSGIKFHEPAAQLRWIHTSPCDKATEWVRGLPKNCIWDSLLVKVLAQLACVPGVRGLVELLHFNCPAGGMDWVNCSQSRPNVGLWLMWWCLPKSPRQQKIPTSTPPQHGWTRSSCKSFKPAELWAERQRWKQVSPMLPNPAALGWTFTDPRHNFPDVVCHPQKQQKLRRFWLWQWQWWCATYSSISQTFPHWPTVLSGVSQRTLEDEITRALCGPNFSDLDSLWEEGMLLNRWQDCAI